MILIVLFGFILIIEFIYYTFYNISNKNKTIEYYRDIPSNENPALVGLMVKGNVDGNDIIATILDLWKKEYINVEYRIIDEEQKCVIKDASKDRFLQLKDYENYLLDELFKEANEVVLEDFIESSKFEIIFKNIGNMVRKRVDLKSIHKISYKRLMNKVNFIVNYIVLGFSIFFSFIFLIFNDFYISLGLSIVINFIVFFLIKKFFINNRLEDLLFGYSAVISIIYFGIIIFCYLFSNYVYEVNLIFSVCNICISFILIFCFIIGKNKKIISTSIIDFLMLIYSICSIIFLNLIGICLCIIYFTHRIYIKSPDHIYYTNNTELEKWEALKNFLNDFSVINERNINEIQIWDKYLIYAIAMGVNKKAIFEYAKLANISLINKNFIDRHYVETIEF